MISMEKAKGRLDSVTQPVNHEGLKRSGQE